jgi:oxaloacetate decarboxylase alpha subunit
VYNFLRQTKVKNTSFRRIEMAVEKKPVKIMETVLRDAHQSLIATRMTTEQMLPIIDKMDKIGYHAVECWGGATFDASLRFLHG